MKGQPQGAAATRVENRFVNSRRARACVGMEKVELDASRGTVRFGCAGMRLDLGGVAKGYALDVAAGVLRRYRVS